MLFNQYIKQKSLLDNFQSKQKYSHTMGTDGVTTNTFAEIIDDEIKIIKRKIQNNTYSISPYKEKLILKSKDSKPRVISIPTNRDKLVLSALQKYLYDRFKDSVSDNNVHSKIAGIKKSIEACEYDSFIKLDIQNFYPSLDHNILFKKVSKKVSDKKALYLLEKALTQTTTPAGVKRVNKDAAINGVAQGLSISNVLSSIYMIEFDKKYLKKKGLRYFRYVDDILILCNKKDMNNIKTSILNDINKLNLEAHIFKYGSNKSSVGQINKDRFQFLGFDFHNNLISVRDSSIDRLRDRIIKLFKTNKNIEEKVFYSKLNLKITGCIYNNKQYGWMYFFAQITDITLLNQLDWFIKKCFKQFNLEYKNNKIKSFVKTYYKLKNLNINKLNYKTYIPKFDSKHIELQSSNTEIKINPEAIIKINLIKIVDNLKDDVEFYNY